MQKKDLFIRLGYHGINHTLDKKGINPNKTIRLETIVESDKQYHISQNKPILKSINPILNIEDGIEKAINIGFKNLEATKKILLWNVKNNITFYRMSSELLPHITNQFLLKLHERENYKKLAYPIKIFKEKFLELAKIIADNKMRITFHPGLHVVLNTKKTHVYINSLRDIYYHNAMIKYLGLTNSDTCIILHGGLGGNLELLIKRLNSLPDKLKKHLVLENDESRYSIEEILTAAEAANLPVVFDQFHHKIYNNISTNLDLNNPNDFKLVKRIKNTWKLHRMKIHISEQNLSNRLGAHSDFIMYIPEWVFKFVEIFEEGIDIMLEAKKTEKALLQLCKKYKNSMQEVKVLPCNF